MGLKIDRALICLIGVLLAAVLIIGPRLPVSFGTLVLFALGFALLALWRTKNRTWPLVPGLYILFLGILKVLDEIFGIRTSGWFEGAFFVIPGLIGILAYGSSKKRVWLLRLSAFLLCFGAFLILRHVPIPFIGSGALFCVCMAAACFLAGFVLGVRGFTYYAGWGWVVIALISIGAKPLRYLLAAAVLCAVAYTLFRTFSRKAADNKDDNTKR